jgi:hypothetical protein
MDELVKRLEALERRLLETEDRLAIYQLIATYGPAVDSLSGDATASLWLEDGVYDSEHESKPLVFKGGAALKALVEVPVHLDLVARGCAHIMSMPHIVLDGDRAIATGYSRLYLRDGAHWRVERLSANRWELERTSTGWNVRRRVNRLLDGREEVHAILGREL